jgi:hypothetical protein
VGGWVDGELMIWLGENTSTGGWRAWTAIGPGSDVGGGVVPEDVEK